MSKYDDILHFDHPVSKTHPQMSMIARAAQFMPFAALTGYESALDESIRMTEDRIENGDADNELLNESMRYLLEHVQEHPLVTILYFEPDEKKSGGAYREITGKVLKARLFERELWIEGGAVIPFDYIRSIDRHPPAPDQ